MSTLRTQYKNFLKLNPQSTLTYEEWIQYGGEDWDNTLLDGLEKE